MFWARACRSCHRLMSAAARLAWNSTNGALSPGLRSLSSWPSLTEWASSGLCDMACAADLESCRTMTQMGTMREPGCQS